MADFIGFYLMSVFLVMMGLGAANDGLTKRLFSMAVLWPLALVLIVYRGVRQW